MILLSGPSHTGKTLWAGRLAQARGALCLSIDHLKMGLIRSGLCLLSPEDPDGALTAFLWPVVREMVKTAVENHQDLVVEGCYIPYDWKSDFPPAYLAHIKALWLVFSPEYIHTQFDQIKVRANAAERRLENSCPSLSSLLADNGEALAQCRAHGCPCLLINCRYPETLSELEDLLC